MVCRLQLRPPRLYALTAREPFTPQQTRTGATACLPLDLHAVLLLTRSFVLFFLVLFLASAKSAAELSLIHVDLI